MLATVTVNGTLCELSIDSQAITWWRKPSKGRPGAQAGQQHSSSSDQSNATDDTSPAKVAAKDTVKSGHQSSATQLVGVQSDRNQGSLKKRKQIDFSQVIGTTRVWPGSKRQTGSDEKENKSQQQHDICSDTKKVQLTNKEPPPPKCDNHNHHNHNRQQHQHKQESQRADSQEPASCSIRKLKVYHVEKRSNGKSSGRLLKLKKITIELPSTSSSSSPSSPSITSSPSSSSASEQKQQKSNGNISAKSSGTKHDTNYNCDADTLANIYELIEQHLQVRRRQRPKRLLIFANPFGGKGKALPLYEKKVKRVLDLACIESQLIVTKYANHARETLEDPQFNVDYFDGIICIGGDGMFSELMNGLLFRFNRDKLLAASASRRAQNGSSSAGGATEATGRAAAVNGRLGSSSDLDSLGSSSTVEQNDPADCNKSNLSSKSSCSSESSSTSSSGGGGGDGAKGRGQETTVIQDGSKVSDRGNSNDNDNNNNNDVDEGINLVKSASASHKTHSARPASELDSNCSLGGVKGARKSDSRQTVSRQQLESLRSSLGGIGERFHSPTIPIGVIGAGSTDANLFGFIGTNDVTSATLNIVLGNQIQIDVGSVHSIVDDKLLRFVSTFVAYGYFGDVVRESEKLRWMGPCRYDITGLNTLIKYRNYEGLVRIIRSSHDGTPHDLNRCHLDCGLCQQNSMTSSLNFNDFSQLVGTTSCELTGDEISSSNSTKTSTSDTGNGHKHSGDCDNNDRGGDSETMTVTSADSAGQVSGGDGCENYELIEKQGPFVGVNAAVTACRCPQTKKGFSPGNHLANGCADLILVRPCTRMQYINYLIRTGYTQKSAFDLKYVEAYRCRQFEFIVRRRREAHQEAALNGFVGSNPALSTWNVDGEILDEQSIRVKVNNKVLRVFGTGEPTPPASKAVRAAAATRAH